MQIRTIDEANQELLPYVPLVAQLTGKNTTLDRILPLMELLGNPQDKICVVHIAGTSGKTSTAYFMAALLHEAGKRTGLTVSPHVDSVTERVQLNGRPLANDVFCEYLGEFLDIVAALTEKPSYFELLYAFSLWVFEREAVEYAVVETGMGGLYDATNVVTREDKLCIITDIGFDHMHVLGHTIPEITAQKAGIIHRHNPVFAYNQSTEVDDVIEHQAEQCRAELHQLSQAAEEAVYGHNFLPNLPDYQRRNWLLAYAAYRFLQRRDSLPLLDAEQLLSTQTVQVPGRMDRRKVGDKTVIMDGAHNGQKMSVFLQSFKHLYPDSRPAVMLALKEGKEPVDIAPLLAGFASRIIITTFQTSQDLPARSIDPSVLAEIFKQAGAQEVEVIEDMHEAYSVLLAGTEKICIITGSFYLLSQLREKEELV